MLVLLINPPAENTVIEYPDESGEGYLESDDFGCFPPLGLLYIAAYLKAHGAGHEVFFLDCVAEKVRQAELAERVRAVCGGRTPEVVGITSFTISLVDVCLAAETLRAVAPRAHICMGGHHPIAFPVEAAKLPQFDSVVVGEGEVAFTELVDRLAAGGDFTDITGVYTADTVDAHVCGSLKDARFLGHVTVPPAYIEDIDALPPPDRTLIDHINYQSIVGVSDKLATIISSRGCPYRCVYCDVPYKQYRGRDPKLVLDEVEACLSAGYKEFHFYDDLFNITPEKVEAFCDEVERRGLNFHWDFRGRVNTVTRESLARARKAGCRMISFGVETGSDEGLKHLRKGATTEKVRQAFGWCRELGIRTIADFMIGLPFEKSEADIDRHVDFLIELDPDYAQFAVLTLYPNTQLFDEAAAKGLIDPERWRAFALNPHKGFMVDHWEEFMSTSELVRIQKKSYNRFYFRPSYIWKSVRRTTSWYEFKAKAKGALKLLSGG